MASTATSKSRMAGAASPAKQRSSSSSQEDRYRFTLANGKVTRLQEFARGRWTNESIDRNEAWSFDGTRLIQMETKLNGVEVTTYTDPDKDGIFARASKMVTPFPTPSSSGLV